MWCSIISSQSLRQSQATSTHQLQSLELREREGLRRSYVYLGDKSHTVGVDDAHVYLNASQITQIAEGCPNLEFLDIDLKRTSSTSLDQDMLNAIASFPSLINLVLRLELPDYGKVPADPEIHTLGILGYGPIINRAVVEHLFRKSRTQQASLLFLQVHIGAWEDRHAEHGVAGPPRHLTGYWRCKVDIEGWEKCDGRRGYNSDWSGLYEDWYERRGPRDYKLTMREIKGLSSF